MHVNDRRKILRLIIDDPASTDVERAEAELELSALTGDQSKPPSRRYGRNRDVPQTQSDVDADLEQALTFRPNDGLTIGDRVEIERGMPESTRAILDAIGDNCLLWLFTNNATDVPVLVDCVGRTQSEVVRSKSLDALRLIAQHSTVIPAKQQAKEFLERTNNEQPTAEPEDRTH